jgi:hypothetical protein
MVPARVGDDPAAAILRGEGGDLVVGAAQLENARRLEALGLEVKRPVLLAARTRHEGRAERHSLQTPPRGFYIP